MSSIELSRGPRRNVYLENRPAEEALEALLAALGEPSRRDGLLTPEEEIPVAEALGRVTARPVFARISSPHFHASAMDGVAVRARETFGASETSPVCLRLNEEAFTVDTGDLIPPGCDAVIMAEDLAEISPGVLQIAAAASPWQHVRPIGEDIVATELVVPGGHLLRPADLGALLASGVLKVPVRSKPRAAIIPTGTELVAPSEAPRPGDLIEYNSVVISGLIQEWGGFPQRFRPVPDDVEAIRRALQEAAETCDIIVINAGSSAGREDFTAGIISELGRLIVHGAAIKPGKPVILGVIPATDVRGRRRVKPVVGLPGYPVSAYITCELFVRPLVFRALGLPEPKRPSARARLARQLPSPMGVEEFVRVKLGRVGENLVATPISRGAGVITSLVKAGGMLRIPRDREGYGEGAEVAVELWRTPEEIERTTVITGSHDVTLDILGNFLRQRFPGASLSSAHVGSLGGITAVRRGEAHAAGVHLLDEETGEYNVSYVRRYLPGTEAVLIHLARRAQGFIVAPGNPKDIRDFPDLAREDVSYINRQRGAGTRVLLDYHLKKAGIAPVQVEGYRREVFTHTAVAAAVANGSADAGLGILAAARALGMDFVPVADEEYELLILRRFYEEPAVQRMLAVIRLKEFQAEVAALGGYDVSETGREKWGRS